MVQKLTAQKKITYLVLLLIGLVGVGIAYFITSQPKEPPRSAAKGELSAYLSEEFKAIGRDAKLSEKKFPVTDAEQVPGSLHNWIGQEITVAELFPGGGVKMLGAGPAAVPGPGKSMQFRLAPEKADVKGELSLFIQQYRQMPVLDDKTSYTLPGRGLGAGAPDITIWRRGGLLCCLVSNTTQGMGLLRQALGAEEPKKPY